MARKRKSGEYTFTINVYEPNTMPLRRLSEYFADLAEILGEEQSVHLIRIEKSSHSSAVLIDPPAEPKIQKRIEEIERGEVAINVRNAVARINSKLRMDNTDAAFIDPAGKNLLIFPGRHEETLEYGPINEAETIYGIPIMVGGKRVDEVPVHLQGRDPQNRYNCVTDRDTAKSIGSYLFDTVLRVEGIGRWLRTPEGPWEMRRFWIDKFEPLGDVASFSFKDSINELRAIPAKWKEMRDPIGELVRIRYEDTEM